MIIGRFIKHRGYEGTIEYDSEEKLHYGSLYDTADSVSYHGKTLEELYDNYKKAIDEYIELKKEISNE